MLVYKRVRIFALRWGVKWLRKTTGSSSTAKSLPVTNHHLFMQRVQMSPHLRGMKFSPSLLPTPLNPLFSPAHKPYHFSWSLLFLVVLFFPFHMSVVMSCIFLFLIDCFSCKCAQTWFPSPQFSQFHFTSQYRSKINTCQVLNARKCTIIPLYAEHIHR